MKKTDLEKNKGLQIKSKMGQAAPSTHFGAAPPEVVNRREQRKLDQAQGLVPFAVKLNSELVTRLQGLAQKRQSGINELVAELLNKALEPDKAAKKK